MNAVSPAEYFDFLDKDDENDSAISDDQNLNFRWPKGSETGLYSQLTPITSITEPKPWISKHSERIAQISRLDSDWDSYGAEAPSEVAINFAYEILSNLAYEDLEPSSIDPSAEGGICISFRTKSRYGDIECFNNGEIFAVTSKNGKETNAWGIDSSLNRLGQDVN